MVELIKKKQPIFITIFNTLTTNWNMDKIELGNSHLAQLSNNIILLIALCHNFIISVYHIYCTLIRAKSKGVQRLSKPNKRLYFSKKNIIKVSQEQNWGEN